jgi:hypothetical protein
MMERGMRYRVAGVVAVAGLLAGGGAGIITIILPPTGQQLVQTTLGSLAVLVLVLLTCKQEWDCRSWLGGGTVRR